MRGEGAPDSAATKLIDHDLCLGAKFCFVGRPFAYGLAAFGGAGVQRTIDIFRGEVDLIMAQIGACTIESLNPHLVVSN
ncbi:MAG: alpha-hydroxy-acid oxidizing protein [Hydrogenophaga sp.]